MKYILAGRDVAVCRGWGYELVLSLIHLIDFFPLPQHIFAVSWRKETKAGNRLLIELQNDSMLYAVAKENKNNTTRDCFLV